MKKMISVLLVSLLLVSVSACAFAATGLGSVTSVTNKGAAADADGAVSVNTTLCAVSLDEEGRILSVSFDVVQSKGTYNVSGEATSENAEPASKVELGDAYGMKPATSIGKEWYEQMAAFETWCVGKTVEEVVNMPTYDKGDGRHDKVPDDVDLKSSCTVSLGDQFAALTKAAAAAK